MEIIVWIVLLMLCIVFSLCATICISKKCTLINIFIGSFSIFFIVYFATKIYENFVVCAVAMIIALIYSSIFYNDFKISYKTVILFVVESAYTLIVVGLYFAIKEIFCQSKQLSVLISAVLVMVLLLIIAGVLKKYIKRINLKNLYYRCKIVLPKKIVELLMYLDSGNILTAGSDRLPVIFVNKSKLKFLDGETTVIKLSSVVGGTTKVKGVLVNNFYIFCDGRWRLCPVVVNMVEDRFYAYDGILNLECI